MALAQLSAETITVSTSAIGVTDSLINTTTGQVVVPKAEVKLIKFQHRAGGNIWGIVGTPDYDGGNGEEQFKVGHEWEVVGQDDIQGFKMIKLNGASNATVDVQLYGAP